MKRHLFVTRTSEQYGLDYILRFEGDVKRQIRIPAPLVFDFSRRKKYRFSDTQFDEITRRYQFHDPTEGVVPDEEERVVYPPVQEEAIAPWGEGSSFGWGGGTFFFFVGGSQDFGVRTRRRIRPMDIPALPWSRSD